MGSKVVEQDVRLFGMCWMTAIKKFLRKHSQSKSRQILHIFGGDRVVPLVIEEEGVLRRGGKIYHHVSTLGRDQLTDCPLTNCLYLAGELIVPLFTTCQFRCNPRQQKKGYL